MICMTEVSKNLHLALLLIQAIQEADLGVIPKVAHGFQLLLLCQIIRQLELRPDLRIHRWNQVFANDLR